MEFLEELQRDTVTSKLTRAERAGDILLRSGLDYPPPPPPPPPPPLSGLGEVLHAVQLELLR